MKFENAYNLIFDFLKNEDESITKLQKNNGIFFAPELYLVFKIGKLLKENELTIFNEQVEWLREYDLKNGGPSDLVFKNTQGELYVFEFKMRNTIHSYLRDIEKLKREELFTHQIKEKVFIALIDVDDKNIHNDARINGVNEEKCVQHFASFPTHQLRYTQTNISCMLAMWKAG